MAVKIDAILGEIGDFGRYQKRIYFLLCFPIIFIGAGNLAFVFIAATPEYRCLVPKCDNVTEPAYNSPFVNFSIPYNHETKGWDKCHRYQRLNNNGTCSASDFSTNVTVDCPEGKVFAKDVYGSTLVTEFNLTCSAAWEDNMAQTIYFAGVLVGAFTFGIVADQIGRRATIILGIFGMAVSGITTALVTGLTTFNVLRFLNATFSSGLFQTCFVLGMEFVGPSKRVMCGIIGEYFFAIGEVILGLISWWLKDWRMIQLVISAPVTCFIFYWWFIPESPRWLQTQGRHQKVVVVLEKVAKGNRRTIPLDMLRNSGDESSEDGELPLVRGVKPVTLLDVVKSPLLCVRMFSMFFIWIITTLVYYGLSLNATILCNGDASSQPFTDFILSALVEMPGYTLAWMGMSLWGRRGSLTLSTILSGVACVGAGFASRYSSEYVLIPALLGKCFITCAFAIIYVFASEMFPTNVRSTILGLSSTFSRIGAMLAPFSSDLALIYVPLPMIVFGGLSFIAGILNVFMPETHNTSLPDTVAEAVNLGRKAPTVVVRDAGIAEEEQNLLNNSCDELYTSDSSLINNQSLSVSIHREDVEEDQQST